MSMGTDAARESLVPKELNLCNKAVEQLFVELSELDNRLVSCLQVAPEQANTDEADQLETGVPLANALARLRLQIYQARDRLSILRERVEL